MDGIGMRRAAAVAAGSLVLVAGGLVAAGCGESTSTDTSAAITVAADGTATLPLRDGGDYTVTMAEGQTTPVDIFGNTGGDPVSVWSGNDSGPVEATVGAPFAIELAQSPSTGYSWKATGGTAPGAVVELVQDWVLTEDKGPGSPGTHYWVYRGTAEGSGTIEFQQFPPGTSSPSKEQVVKVIVTK